jgi:hypothetical protein
MSIMNEKDNTLLERGADSDIVRLRWRLKIRENIIGRLVAENERLRNGAAAARETVCPHVRGKTTHYCSLNFTLTDAEREAIEAAIFSSEVEGERFYAATLRSLLERLRTTPTTHATPAEGAVQAQCTFTDEERAAILTAADLLIGSKPGATLRNLLARLS